MNLTTWWLVAFDWMRDHRPNYLIYPQFVYRTVSKNCEKGCCVYRQRRGKAWTMLSLIKLGAIKTLVTTPEWLRAHHVHWLSGIYITHTRVCEHTHTLCISYICTLCIAACFQLLCTPCCVGFAILQWRKYLRSSVCSFAWSRVGTYHCKELKCCHYPK